MKVINVVGARPNFMKIAPIIRAIKSFNQANQRNQTNLSREMGSLFHGDQRNQRNLIDYKLVHTGQHYDYEMSKVFFEDLELPEPDIYLGVGSGSHAEQTGRVMIEFEKVLFKQKPDLVVVVGDVNSTLACALAASKIDYSRGSGINSKVDPVKGEQILFNNLTNSKNPINTTNARGYRPLIAHVEAGLRSFDRTMPEEINRLLTDQISDFLFTPSRDANKNLSKEGIPEEKIFLVGNVMVDSLLYNLEKAKQSTILDQLDLRQRSLSDHCSLMTDYCLLTLHRPSNVDNKDVFLRIINALIEISKHIPIIFPIHPRTRKQIEAFGLSSYFVYHDVKPINQTNQINQRNKKNQRNQTNQTNRINLIDPLGYLDFLNLMMHSTFVMTDSGGIQEETTVLGIPCLTLRDTTERPITISQGTNVLVRNDTHKIIDEAFKILDRKGKTGNHPELWDGKAAERIVEVLLKE
jgi:UDP-N-acetylglucosamine 2-epimerase (non-hydrolysing)